MVNGTTALYLIGLYQHRHYQKVSVPQLTYRATHNALVRAGYELMRVTDYDEQYLAQHSYSPQILTVYVGLFGAQPKINQPGIEDGCQSWITSQSTLDKAISFDPTKNLASIGNGGAVLTNDPELANYVERFIRNDNEIAGLNLRMTEIEAGSVLLQFDYLTEDQTIRRQIMDEYAKSFGSRLIYDHSSNHDLQKAVIKTPLVELNTVETKMLYKDVIDMDLMSIPIYPELNTKEVEFIIKELGDRLL